MNRLLTKEFNEAWDSLNILNDTDKIEMLLEHTSISDFKLTEDTFDKSKLTLSSILEKGRTGKGEVINDPAEIQALIEETKKACKNFGVSESSWAYVLQLLCNAYSTELAVQTALNNDSIENPNGIKNITTAALAKKLKMSSDSFSLNFSTKYDFVGVEGAHNLIYDASKEQEDKPDLSRTGYDVQKANSTDKSLVKNGGRHTESFNFDINTIEIKTTHNSEQKVGNRRAHTYHNADLVYIYSISDEKSGKLYARLKLKENQYSVAAVVFENFEVPTVEITANAITISPFKGHSTNTNQQV